MAYVMGIDVGTSAVKVILVSEKGEMVSAADAEYPLLTPRPGWAEQEPEDWWQGTVAAARSCLEKAEVVTGGEVKVAAVGLSGQMHGSVFLNGEGRVLRPALLWCDQRTEAQCNYITRTVGQNKLVELTCNKALTGFTAPKLLWLKQEEPELYSQVSKVLLPKDYIRYRMTGEFATEVSDASGTLLFNVAGRDWSEDMLQALGIPRHWLPECFESLEVSGHVNKEAARALGLQEGTPVVGGGGDQAAGAVGNGIVREGTSSCVLGTSGVVFWHAEAPVFDQQGRLHCFCHAVPQKWHLMGVTLSAGGALQWFRDSLCIEEKKEAWEQGISPYRIIDRQADEVPAGSEGLIFLPYLAGERTPHADAAARGAFIGLSLRHGKPHLARALMEGVSMSLRDCLELGRELGLKTSRVCLSGGGARSLVWRQITADIFNVEVFRAVVDEGPAYGAAVLAAVGAGMVDTVEDACQKFIRVADTTGPDPSRNELYEHLYALYRSLYPSLRSFYSRNHAFLQQYYKD